VVDVKWDRALTELLVLPAWVLAEQGYDKLKETCDRALARGFIVIGKDDRVLAVYRRW